MSIPRAIATAPYSAVGSAWAKDPPHRAPVTNLAMPDMLCGLMEQGLPRPDHVTVFCGAFRGHGPDGDRVPFFSDVIEAAYFPEVHHRVRARYPEAEHGHQALTARQNFCVQILILELCKKRNSLFEGVRESNNQKVPVSSHSPLGCPDQDDVVLYQTSRFSTAHYWTFQHRQTPAWKANLADGISYEAIGVGTPL